MAPFAGSSAWLLLVGGEAEEAIPDSTLLDRDPILADQRRTRRATRLRLVSLFRRGWTRIRTALLTAAARALLREEPPPWVLDDHLALRLAGDEGFALIERLRAEMPAQSLIRACQSSTSGFAVAAPGADVGA